MPLREIPISKLSNMSNELSIPPTIDKDITDQARLNTNPTLITPEFDRFSSKLKENYNLNIPVKRGTVKGSVSQESELTCFNANDYEESQGSKLS